MGKTTDKTTDTQTDTQTMEHSQAPARTGAWIEITCPSGPRRRAGLNFGPVPVVINASELTRDQELALGEDTMLVIRPAAAPAEPDSAE
jgi:hypothetical protein